MTHGDLHPNDPRLRVNPEEVNRIVEDIMKPYAAKHAMDKLSDTESAVVKGKAIHQQVVRAAKAEVEPNIPLDHTLWRLRLMDAYRTNFHTHMCNEELIEILAVMHTEMALEVLENV